MSRSRDPSVDQILREDNLADQSLRFLMIEVCRNQVTLQSTQFAQQQAVHPGASIYLGRFLPEAARLHRQSACVVAKAVQLRGGMVERMKPVLVLGSGKLGTTEPFVEVDRVRGDDPEQRAQPRFQTSRCQSATGSPCPSTILKRP